MARHALSLALLSLGLAACAGSQPVRESSVQRTEVRSSRSGDHDAALGIPSSNKLYDIMRSSTVEPTRQNDECGDFLETTEYGTLFELMARMDAEADRGRARCAELDGEPVVYSCKARFSGQNGPSAWKIRLELEIDHDHSVIADSVYCVAE